MPTDNIIDAAARFAARMPEGERRPAPSSLDRAVDQLRSSARLPQADRPILACGLGRLAAQISPDAPLEGVKTMFKHTGNGWEAKWPKRRRLVRLPTEPADQTYEYGAFEGGGPAYLVLADAAAAILAGSKTATQRDLDRARREILRGTTLLPEATPLAASALAARDLLADWAATLCSRIQTETRLPELLDVLQAAPFTTEILGDIWARSDGEYRVLETESSVIEKVRAEPAGEAALGATMIARPRWKEGTNLKFTSDISHRGLDWTQPTLRIGRLAGKATEPTFIFPPDIAVFMHSSFFKEDDYVLPPAVKEWFISIGMGSNSKMIREEIAKIEDKPVEPTTFENIILGKLPSVPWSQKTGYGWRNLDYFRSADVWLEVAHGSTGMEFSMHVSGHSNFPELAPFVPAFGPNTQENIRSCFASRQGWLFEGQYFSGLDDEYMTLHWPEADQFGENSGSIIGLIDNYSSGEPFEDSVHGWLESPEISSLLLTSDRWQFFPEIVCPAAPVPCAAKSIAAAIFQNLAGAPKEFRLDNIIIEQANAIAQSGLAYYEALVDHYRNAVKAP